MKRCAYSDLIKELQNMWRDYKVKEVYSLLLQSERLIQIK